MSDHPSEKPENNISPEYVSAEERFARARSAEMPVTEKKEEEPSREKSSEESERSYEKILSKVDAKKPHDDKTLMSDASALDQQKDRESQITHLLDLAMTKGVEHAVKVAQKAEDYYVLDQLHDRLLADDLHDALRAKGFIKE